MIEILRLSHRPFRDKRLTTHVALAARAFGADSIAYSGIKDTKLESTITNIVDKFGGNFSIKYEKNPISYIKEKKAGKRLIVHLTVYGSPIKDKIANLRNKDILLIVGSEKVPLEIYSLADFNIAITNQPHSEVSSISCFLDYFFEGKELMKIFRNPKFKIVPQEKGKLVNSKLYK